MEEISLFARYGVVLNGCGSPKLTTPTITLPTATSPIDDLTDKKFSYNKL